MDVPVFDSKTMTTSNTRRSFLTTAAGAVAAPFILPGRIWSADASPNGKIRMGFIGMGKQMGGLISRFLQYPEVEVVAVCDVYAMRRDLYKKKVDEHYAKNGGTGKPCASVNDFREITERGDIDAVCIATPDHWHAIITNSALSHGKDVYCEKPLTHNIHEAVAVVETAKKYNRVLQTGSMQRSSKEFRVACELVRNGVIGDIKTVTVSFGDPALPNAYPEEPKPEGLDWNLWCGPAPLVPFNHELCPIGESKVFPNWRKTREFGGGMITDWGAHHIDIAQWGLGMDENGPVEVRAPANHQTARRGGQLVYASGVVLTHAEGSMGCTFHGTEGVVNVGRGKFALTLGGKDKFAFRDKETSKGTSVDREVALAEREFLANAKTKLYVSKDQIADFIGCVKSRQQPICHAGVGASSAIACHLMNFGYWYGANAKWNPTGHKFISGGDDKWLTREYRGEWKV